MLCLHYGMIRTQIQLTEEQARRLRRAARAQGVSMAEVVRRCIDQGLAVAERGERYARAAGLVGAFEDRGGTRRVAEEHDRYLGDAFE
jgi:hypothetical protein